MTKRPQKLTHEDWDWETLQWATAMDELSIGGKSSTLVDKLRGPDPITPAARELLAMLVQQMIAPPALKDRDWRMLDAAEEFRERQSEIRRGDDRKDATTALLAEIARKYQVTPLTDGEEIDDDEERQRDFRVSPEAAKKQEQKARDEEDARALRKVVVRQAGGNWKRLRFVKKSLNDL